MSLDKVAGECPMGCGRTLFLGDGGHVTCSLLGCPAPGVITKMLEAAGPAQRVEADPPEPAITDEMVERAAEVIEDECGYALASHLGIESPHSPYWKFRNARCWKQIARHALEAALGIVA